MTKHLSIAFLITGFLVGDAYGEDRIADVYFDDGSVLHDAKFTPYDSSDEITVKYENETFTLNFKDLKSLEFKVEPIKDKKINYGITTENNGLVTLKVKTKTGIVINNQFEVGSHTSNGHWSFCLPKQISFTNKLTGRKISKSYNITNLAIKDRDRSTDEYAELLGYARNHELCIFKKAKTKAIKSIVFKDD